MTYSPCIDFCGCIVDKLLLILELNEKFYDIEPVEQNI